MTATPVPRLRHSAASAVSILLKHLTRPGKRCAEVQRLANAFTVGTYAENFVDNSLVARVKPTYHNHCSRRVGNADLNILPERATLFSDSDCETEQFGELV